jgi:hypothetical protein
MQSSESRIAGRYHREDIKTSDDMLARFIVRTGGENEKTQKNDHGTQFLEKSPAFALLFVRTTYISV